MHASRKVATISWLNDKPISILSIAFNPINLASSIFSTWWYLISPLKMPTSPMLMHYQEHMHGIIVQDQLHDNYTWQRCNHKWLHQIIFHVIGTTTVNSYIMYKSAYDPSWQVHRSNVAFEVQCDFGKGSHQVKHSSYSKIQHFTWLFWKFVRVGSSFQSGIVLVHGRLRVEHQLILM